MRVLIKASAMALMATVALPSSSSHDGARVGSGASSPASSRAGSEAQLFPTPELRFPGNATGEGGAPSESAQADDPRRGQAAKIAQSQASDRAPPPPASAGLQVERGDKLRLGFYETVELGGEQQAGRGRPEAQGALRTFYQRMDLSGEYTVEGNGAFSIPLLGEFRAAGRDIDDIRGELAASFTAVTGRSARVDARILDRAPVYVVGPVKSPGAVRYASGMFVLQALALAGGLDRGADNPSAKVEGAREVERLRLARLQIDRLMARRARLEAQRGAPPVGLTAFESAPTAILISDDGAASPPMHPRSPPRSAEPFGASEDAILQAEEAKRRQRERELAARVGAAQNEVEAIRSKLSQFDIQKDMRTERLETMQKLRDRGVDTIDHVLTLRTELADIEARRQDCRVTLVEAEARLAQAEDETRKDALDYTTDLAKEIAAVDKDIADAREAAGSAEAMAAILYGFAGPGAQPHYEIVRETAGGAADLQASETSPLMPGDVLKVR